MHIPDHMLQGAVCPVTAALSIAGVGLAAVAAAKSKEKPNALTLGAVGALVFAAQMMNFPVSGGTSGHLIGATLATSLLGGPFGVLVMTLVLVVQTLVFSDGGITVLGANVLNMALIGSLAGTIVHMLAIKPQPEKKVRNMLLVAAASWVSVVIASLACSLELAISGTAALSTVLPSMLGVHALIGIGEALITVPLVLLLSSTAVTRSSKAGWILPLSIAGGTGLLLSPLASGLPDGLEWVAERFRFYHESAPVFTGLMPDYVMPLVSHNAAATALAGIIGVAIVFAVALGIGFLYKRNSVNELSAH